MYKKRVEHEQGHRITDKEALKELLTQEAKRNELSINRVLAKELPRFQKKLSQARQKIPKNTKK
jgi:hypothetical protein